MYSVFGLTGQGDSYLWMIVMLFAAYLLGNISPAILLGRLHGIDIRKEGSGNAGTTNVLRVLGKRAAAMTLIIDILKGTAAVACGGILLGHTVAMYCVVAVFIGHVWPIFFGLKGGKGVATAFGSISGLNPLLGLAALAVVILVVLLTRRMSAGSIVGGIVFPFIAYFLEPSFILPGTVMVLIILWKHRSNVYRLIKGEEPKINFKK